MIILAIGVIVGLSAAMAQDSAMPLDLTKYVEVLRGYAERMQKDLGRADLIDGAQSGVVAVRDAATVDRVAGRGQSTIIDKAGEGRGQGSGWGRSYNLHIC